MNLKNNKEMIFGKLKKNEKKIEILSAIAVIIIMITCFGFSLSYVSGGIETKWAIREERHLRIMIY